MKSSRPEQTVMFASAAMPTMEEIRAAIRRGPRGIQTQLAQDLGVPVQQINTWLLRRVPQYHRIPPLVDALRGRGLLE